VTQTTPAAPRTPRAGERYRRRRGASASCCPTIPSLAGTRPMRSPASRAAGRSMPRPQLERRRRDRADDGARSLAEPAGPDPARGMALKPCLGRGRLTSASRCPACRLRRPRGRRWQEIRRQVFARYGRVCVHCGAPATDVDHL